MPHGATWEGEPRWARLLAGSFAGTTAEILTFPIDMAKVRLQIDKKSYNGMFDCIRKVAADEGFGALYQGIHPAVVRQMSYQGIKMTMYEPIRDFYASDPNNMGFTEMFMAGGTAGAIGISIANPAELIKIRMQADKTGVRYGSGFGAFFKALGTTARAEGLASLWRGVIPNIQRAFIVNAAELGSYDRTKQFFVEQMAMNPDGVGTHFMASMGAGLFTAVVSSPIDLIKNRMMQQVAGEGPQYTGVIDCAMQTVKKEGPLGLYNGFIPQWLRLGPWCVAFFLSYEQYRIAARMVWQDKDSEQA